MSPLPRLALLVLVLSLSLAAPASAASVKIVLPSTAEPPKTTFLYVEANPDVSGEIGVCVNGAYYGGEGSAADPDADGWMGDQNECERSAETTVNCGSAAACQQFVVGLLGGVDGAPRQEGCEGATGGDATCVYFGEKGDFLLADSPQDQHGELGVCVDDSYYYVTGPDDPGGEADVACPRPGPPVQGEPPPPPPPPPPADSDGDGVADPDDRCPQTAASTSDGCPPPSPPADSGQTAPPSETSPPPEGDPPPPPPSRKQSRRRGEEQPPRAEIAQRRLRVSRKGRVAIPIACRSRKTSCVGEVRLTTFRRTKSGKRVRVLLAVAGFHVDGGETTRRRVRLTKAGRRLLVRRGKVVARAKLTVAGASGKVVRRERLSLRAAKRRSAGR